MRFATVVRRVEYNTNGDDFSVTAKDLKDDRETTERFSHVVVASGIFTIPKIPEIPGISQFQGRVQHSKNVKHLNEYKGQRMLLIGPPWSGDDLAMLCIKFGAKASFCPTSISPWVCHGRMVFQNVPSSSVFRNGRRILRMVQQRK